MSNHFFWEGNELYWHSFVTLVTDLVDEEVWISSIFYEHEQPLYGEPLQIFPFRFYHLQSLCYFALLHSPFSVCHFSQDCSFVVFSAFYIFHFLVRPICRSTVISILIFYMLNVVCYVFFFYILFSCWAPPFRVIRFFLFIFFLFFFFFLFGRNIAIRRRQDNFQLSTVIYRFENESDAEMNECIYKQISNDIETKWETLCPKK